MPCETVFSHTAHQQFSISSDSILDSPQTRHHTADLDQQSRKWLIASARQDFRHCLHPCTLVRRQGRNGRPCGRGRRTRHLEQDEGDRTG